MVQKSCRSTRSAKSPDAVADIVNLRRARKTVARRAKEAEAAANRVAHGIPKALRTAADAQRRVEDRNLDAHSREPSGET